MTDSATHRGGRWQAEATVGELKRVLAGYPDDMPLGLRVNGIPGMDRATAKPTPPCAMLLSGCTTLAAKPKTSA